MSRSLPRRPHDEDSCGRRRALILIAGQSYNGEEADGLLDHVGTGTIVLADKAYDADRIWASLREKGAFANIPPKSNSRSKPYFSTWLYRERNLIERFFTKLKHFRRVATRCVKLAENFLAMVQLVSMHLGFVFISLRPSIAASLEIGVSGQSSRHLQSGWLAGAVEFECFRPHFHQAGLL